MPLDERASTVPPSRRAARRALPATASNVPAAPTRRQLRGATSASAAWQPRPTEEELTAPPVVQVEVVKPDVAEPSTPRMVEPVTAPAPVESVVPQVAAEPIVIPEPHTTAPAAHRNRRRRTSSTVAPILPESAAEPAAIIAAPDVPRIAEPAAPRLSEPAAPVASHIDEFERAAKLFSFSDESPTISTAPATAVSPVSTTSTADAAAPTAPRTRRARRITAASLSLAAIGAVGLLTVGMTLPTQAVAAATGAPSTGAAVQLAGDTHDGGDGGIQAYVAPAGSDANGGDSLQRSGGFTTGTEVQLAGTAGIQNVSGSVFSNNQNCPVQWPFAVGVPISYGFGPRPGEFHEGVDFTPGMGAHIQAIADGVVVVAQDNYQGYGTAVIIDHVIDGQRIASLYGHMELGSLQVHVGEHVKVAEYIGRTGDTGHSYGAHTHVEIRMNDVTPIDPLPWLRAHNQC